MKQVSKDPFEAAFEEEEDESPAVAVDAPQQDDDDDYDEDGIDIQSSAADPSTSTAAPTSTPRIAAVSVAKSHAKNKDDDQEEEEEDNMDVELSKLPSAADPAKMAKMQYALLFPRIIAQSFTSALGYLCFRGKNPILSTPLPSTRKISYLSLWELWNYIVTKHKDWSLARFGLR